MRGGAMATLKRLILPGALPYVNNVPHLGNIIGCVLSSVYCRLRGYNTLYTSGTDECSIATETKAVEENCSPQEISDKYHAIPNPAYEWFNKSFDEVGRTSTPQQTEDCQPVFHELMDNHRLSENTMQQLYCDTCQRFLAVHLFKGTCPTPGCNYDSAPGHQCEICTQLLNPANLKDSKCKKEGSSALSHREANPKGKTSNVTQSGAWDNRLNDAHTTSENKQKTNGGLPTKNVDLNQAEDGCDVCKYIASDVEKSEPFILLVAPTCRCNQQGMDPMIDEARISLLNHPRAANLKGQPSDVTESGAWFYEVIGYTPCEMIWKIKKGLLTKNVEFYHEKDGHDVCVYSASDEGETLKAFIGPICNKQWRDPAINEGWVDIRPQPREDDVQVYHLELDHTPCMGPMINEAKISLVNEDWVMLRAQDIFRADNEQIHGGGGSSTVVQQTGGNIEDVGHFGNATPASDQLPTCPFNQREQLGRLSRFRQVIKRFLRRRSIE